VGKNNIAPALEFPLAYGTSRDERCPWNRDQMKKKAEFPLLPSIPKSVKLLRRMLVCC
jgi:hypothetical protein